VASDQSVELGAKVVVQVTLLAAKAVEKIRGKVKGFESLSQVMISIELLVREKS
jgi:hypothetical protein